MSRTKIPMSDYWTELAYNGGMVPCHAQHPNSCEKDAFIKFLKVATMALKLYTPLHMLPLIIFKRKAMLKTPLRELYFLAKNIVRSVLFLSVYVASFWYGTCIFKKMRGKMDPWNIVLSSILCSLSIFFEPSKRRVELALFLFPRFIEQIMLTL